MRNRTISDQYIFWWCFGKKKRKKKNWKMIGHWNYIILEIQINIVTASKVFFFLKKPLTKLFKLLGSNMVLAFDQTRNYKTWLDTLRGIPRAVGQADIYIYIRLYIYIYENFKLKQKKNQRVTSHFVPVAEFCSVNFEIESRFSATLICIHRAQGTKIFQTLWFTPIHRLKEDMTTSPRDALE